MDQLIAPAVFLPIIARSALPPRYPWCPLWLKFFVPFVFSLCIFFFYFVVSLLF